jgi:hypothetical protein
MYASNVSDYGDSDPEDAWDASDEPKVKFALIKRIVDSIEAEYSAEPHGIRTSVRLLWAIEAIKALRADLGHRHHRALEHLLERLRALA